MSDSMKDLLERVKTPGAFARWRMPVEEGHQVWPELARVAQGIESYAQELKQYVAEGNSAGVAMALEALLKHQAELLSAVVSDEAAEHALAAAYKIGGKGL
jgi:hypothetical protein